MENYYTEVALNNWVLIQFLVIPQAVLFITLLIIDAIQHRKGSK